MSAERRLNKPGGGTGRSFLSSLIATITTHISHVIRRLNKVVLHFLTGKSELERICVNEKVESTRIRLIEKCLRLSKNSYLSNLTRKALTDEISEEKIVANIMDIKHISREVVNSSLSIVLKDGIMKINAYNALIAELEAVRHQAFSFADPEHEEMIQELWHGLKGSEDKLDGQITKRWSEIGFQGQNPGTDFRGMGILGLLNLRYFAVNVNETARSIFSKSLHPVHGYPFAIVGINITSWIQKLLIDGHLKTHFYNNSGLLEVGKISMENIHKIYCIIFSEFDQFWFNSKQTVMNFEMSSKQLNRLITEKLDKDPHAIIRPNFLGMKAGHTLDVSS